MLACMAGMLGAGWMLPSALTTRAHADVMASPQNPGEVALSKTATPVAGKVNTWDVTLRVEGKDRNTTTDIVLVIDRSGSMVKDTPSGSPTKMDEAKDAADQFADALLTDSASKNTRIAVVSFASDVTKDVDFTSSAQTVKDGVDALSANGGTYTQAAVRQAENLLARSTADNKQIVLLSDGLPTYSYAIKSSYQVSDPRTVNYISPRSPYGWETNANLPKEAFDSSQRVGSGNTVNTDLWYRSDVANGSGGRRTNPRDVYQNPAGSAIAEAGFAKAAGNNLWTVAVDAGDDGTATLEQMASPGKAYTASPSDLTSIFEEIAAKIGSAVSDADVTDPMGPGFEIAAADVSSIATDPKTTASYDAATRTIHWAPGTLTKLVPGTTDVRYAELTYRVTINDSILGETPNADGLYPANGDARISYLDDNGQNQTRSFPVPYVNPVFYSVTKKVTSGDSEVITSDTFSITVTGPNGYSHTLQVKGGETTPLLTDLRDTGTYKVSEAETDGYDSSIVVDGAAGSSFTITDDSTADVHVVVTNATAAGGLSIVKELADGSPAGQFTGTYTCTAPDSTQSTGIWSVAGAGTAQLTKKTGANPDALPVGATCVVTEDSVPATAAYSWDKPTIDYGSGATQAVIGKRQTSTVTIRNAARENLGAVVWSKVDAADSKALLGGSEWRIEGPNGLNAVVADNVAGTDGVLGDADSAAGQFKVTGLPWGHYAVTEVKNPESGGLYRYRHV